MTDRKWQESIKNHLSAIKQKCLHNNCVRFCTTVWSVDESSFKSVRVCISENRFHFLISLLVVNHALCTCDHYD